MYLNNATMLTDALNVLMFMRKCTCTRLPVSVMI